MVYGTIAILEPEKQIYPKYSWGEMYETLKTMKENGDDSEDPVFTRFFEAVKELDDAKTLTEVKTILTKYNFSTIEIERINSPCYDGLTFVLKVPEGELISKLVDEQKYIETCKYLLLKDMAVRTLLRACRYNNLEMVKLMFINSSHIERNKALLSACACNHIDTVKFLVQNGAEINYKNDTPICIASQNGHLEIVKFLVEKGADIHTDDNYSLTYAIKNKRLKVVEFLLQQGALINIKCVSFAIQSERLDIIELLCDSGAPFSEQFLQQAIDTENISIINYVISRFNFSSGNIKVPPSISSTFYDCIMKNSYCDSNIISSLLKSGHGEELLKEAVKTHRLYMVKFLLKKGVKNSKKLSSKIPEIQQLLHPQDNSHKKCTIM